MKFILLLLIFISLILINCKQKQHKNNNELFLNWGFKNNLKISSFIEASLLEDNKIKFIAKEDIPKNEEIIMIPNSIMLNVTKTLKLLNFSNLTNQYKIFEELNLTYKPNPYDFRKEEAFITYIFYLIQHNYKKLKKSNFLENYEKYWKSIKKYSIKSALFYDQEQKELLSGSSLFNSINLMNKIFEDEIKILSNNIYYNKYIDLDDYIQHRLFVHNKGLNITNHWTLVPFLNFLDDDYSSYNSNYTIEKNGDLKIISKRNIKKGDEIILKSKKKSNIRRLLTEGKTNEKLVDYFEEFLINAFSPGLIRRYEIKDIEPFLNHYINLRDKDFESKATKLYIDKAGLLKGDGSDTWAYSVLQANLAFYKQYFEYITLSKIYETFSEKEDRINVERLLRGEKRVIEKAI